LGDFRGRLPDSYDAPATIHLTENEFPGKISRSDEVIGEYPQALGTFCVIAEQTFAHHHLAQQVSVVVVSHPGEVNSLNYHFNSVLGFWLKQLSS